MLRETVLGGVREAVSRGQERGLLPARGVPDLHLEVPHRSGFGDYSCNLALLWAGEADGEPRRLASRIVDCLAPTDLVQEVRVEGPGFLNFFLSPRARQEVVRQAQDPGFAFSAPGGGGSVRVEAPAGPPDTLRALRAEAVAGTLVRLLRATGHEVVRVPGPPDRIRVDEEVLAVQPVRVVGAPEPDVAGLLQELGPDVLHFLLVQPPLEHDLALDPARAADPSLENPCRRVQYAHARAAGLERMARDQGTALPEDPEALDLSALGPEEAGLVRALEELPWTVRRAALHREVHRVPAATLELAGLFHPYYNQQPILEAGVRLALARAVRRALAACCGLMGVAAPERT